MFVNFDIKFDWQGGDPNNPRLGVRFQRQAFREAYEELGQYWFRHLLPEHFKPSAFQRYGLQPRSQAYRKRKDRLKARGRYIAGSETPNVATGRGRQEFTQYASIRGFPSRVTVRTFGPRYFRFTPKPGSNQPNKLREITAVNESDLAELARAFEQIMVSKINAELTRRREAGVPSGVRA